MKHQTIDQLKQVAQIDAAHHHDMSRAERLTRWAELLEMEPHRRLATLHQTEYQALSVRSTMRCAGSPISVAYDDPVLREQGLADDTYGEAKRFFELTDAQLHGALCYCHYGATVRAATAARNVRAAIKPGLFTRLQEFFAR
ncbi:hypothetical protein [Mesorhizobium sp. 1M-11]|uniref:hypothetical protein n=1 Tax=Mesorhizobium sp. 1M-11 TaxID=1529006 RepID=UPI0006C74087|nr:hypothetical protein [Mesorhizobium sp. 1M-11]